QTWQTRLMLSTSGIGVMSEESLKSLKYCLDWLRWANNHLGKCIETLKTVLEEYERNRHSQQNRNVTSNEGCAVSVREDAEQERRKMLMGHMDYLKGEVMKTLKRVISVVDSYAGGALVGETRAMVKRQLLHLPKRLQVALVAHTPGAGGTRRQVARRVIIVAKEGLDMMHNVSKLVEIALVGAEEWFEKLGRKREPEDNKTIDDGEDVKMVEAGQE
ncbi:transcription factor Opi1-domain-containing protein, partial [Kalaharituber pfeilii]